MRIDNRQPQYRARSHARWLTVILLAAFIAIFFANTAEAYNCTDQGQPGWFNGTTDDDAGCITEAEYVQLYSVENLIAEGILDVPVDMGDGTVVIVNPSSEIIADPLERPVAATPRLEPDAPTVGEILFPFRPREMR